MEVLIDAVALQGLGPRFKQQSIAEYLFYITVIDEMPRYDRYHSPSI